MNEIERSVANQMRWFAAVVAVLMAVVAVYWSLSLDPRRSAAAGAAGASVAMYVIFTSESRRE
jgi:hypothetical protein